MTPAELVQREALEAEACYMFDRQCGKCVWCIAWSAMRDLGPWRT